MEQRKEWNPARDFAVADKLANEAHYQRGRSFDAAMGPGPMSLAAVDPVDNFPVAFKHLLESEGGYQANPVDKGNANGGCTNLGITLATYRRSTGNASLSCADLKALTQEQAGRIYKSDYWTKPGLGYIKDARVALVVFDQAVIRGPVPAIAALQLTVNTILKTKLTLDGRLGPVTLAALERISALLFIREYLQLYRQILCDIVVRDHTQIIFLKGWQDRVSWLEDAVYDFGSVATIPTPPPVVKPVEPTPSVKPVAGAIPWFTWAEGELGVSELAGSKANNSRILWYHSHTKYNGKTDEVPWCASFVQTALQENGYKSNRDAAAVGLLNVGTELTQPKTGAIMVLDHSRVGGSGHHVTFYKGSARSGYFFGLGGNQSNRVRVTEYSLKEVMPHGMRWPVRA